MQSSFIKNINCIQGLSELPDGYIDLFLTSPPYGGLRKYHGFSWDFEATAKLVFEKAKQGAVVCWNTGDEVRDGVPCLYPERQLLYFADLGFLLWETIYWVKHGIPSPTPGRYYNVAERIYILSKGKPKTFNPISDRKNVSQGRVQKGMTRTSAEERTRSGKREFITQSYGRRTNVWAYGPQQNHTGHPAKMPEKLAADLIISYSNPGDIVCDPFSGSGTTCIAAQKLDRQGIGFEISPEYAVKSQMALMQLQTDIFSH